MDKFYMTSKSKWKNFSRNMFHLGGSQFYVPNQKNRVNYWFGLTHFKEDIKIIEYERSSGIMWS
jgi:hypothetical protein